MKMKDKGAVQWFLIKDEKRKTPRAYSTKAVSDLIVALAEKYDTIREIYENINYDPEAKAIMKMYIDAGEGHYIAREHFA